VTARGGTTRGTGSTREGFTLTELVMSIAVLALAGVFLAQVFLSADRVATKASDLDRAVSLCTTAVDQWKGSDAPRSFQDVDMLADAEAQSPTSALQFLDAGMNPCAQADAVFTVTGTIAQDGDLARLSVTVAYKKDTAVLYEIESARFARAQERG